MKYRLALCSLPFTLADSGCRVPRTADLTPRSTARMIKALAAMLFSILLCLGSVVDASAQQSTSQGWVFGFDFGGAAVSFQNNPSDRGPLVGARAGYGLNRIVTLYAAAYEADIDVKEFDAFDKVSFGHIDYGMRLHLANSRRRWVPYADIALFTFRPVRDVLKNGERNTTDFSSLPSASLGAGLAIYLSESWALDVNFKGGQSAFNDVEVGNISNGATREHTHTFLDIPTKSNRLTIGISWWP